MKEHVRQPPEIKTSQLKYMEGEDSTNSVAVVNGETIRMLVTGGRDYNNREELYQVLDSIHIEKHIDVIIHGAARGADILAGDWARERGVEVIACPADWTHHGKNAGPIRNRQMIKHEPHFVVAFPGGRGTADMLNVARKAGIEVIIKVEPS
jgi:hypothetical protein